MLGVEGESLKLKWNVYGSFTIIIPLGGGGGGGEGGSTYIDQNQYSTVITSLHDKICYVSINFLYVWYNNNSMSLGLT